VALVLVLVVLPLVAIIMKESAQIRAK